MASENKFSALEKCIIYLVSKLQSELTRTKLIKLLFLADFNHFKKKKTTITGVKYYSYFYGPYSEEIMKAINRLNGFEIEEFLGFNKEGKEYYIYTLGKNPRYSKIDLLPNEKETLDSVIKDFADLPLIDLLEYVYKTEPYRKSKKGCPIDLK